MPYTIRQLGPSDIALMHGLLTVFGDAFEEVDTYGARRPGDDYLRKLLSRDTFIALAALADDAVVGGLAAYEMEKFEQERSEIYIYDLAVSETHRRQGIATALIREVVRVGQSRGAWNVMVQADYVDPPAIALYSKLGTRLEILHFDIPVPGDSTPR